MTLLVDTSVWSLFLRRDTPADSPHVAALRTALGGSDLVVTTGLVLQELLQGLLPGSTRTKVMSRFARVPVLQPTRADHIAAAELGATCRRAGVQVGTVDALIAQLCIGRNVALLAADRDFEHIARHVPLRLHG